ncbi:MAG: undecaprenyldiphospho-muramoylpentapeptide beta-N-acetylglucosaminyltransferase [Bacteroidota bacterium]
MKQMKVIISGGGSGGHIFPAIAIANELKRQNAQTEILFVGAQEKIEMEKVPKAGYPIEGLWISGIHRKLTLRNLLFPIKLLVSLWKAYRIISRFKPDVVIGVGGFASYPTLAVASRRGIPTLIQEQNSYAGLSNKLLKSTVDKVCVAYDQMERFFPAAKIVLTGNPVRQDIFDLADKKVAACQHFGFDPQKPILLLFGGSLGARTLNDGMGANTELLRSHPEIQVLWQAGKLYIDEFAPSATAQLDNVKISAFIDRMDLAYAMADVVICRAGALTISELCLVKKPAILIPSPNVAEDHQTSNAMNLVGKEAAILVKDQMAKEKMLAEAIRVLNDDGLKHRLGENIAQLGKKDAARGIVAEILALVEKEE